MEEDKWTQNGISFRHPKLEDLDKVFEYLKVNFFPEEPVTRSVGFAQALQGDGLIDKLLQMIGKEFIKDCLKKETSLIAVDKDDNIMGCK